MSNDRHTSPNPDGQVQTEDAGKTAEPNLPNVLFHPNFDGKLKGNLASSLPKLFAAKRRAGESIKRMLDLVNRNPEALESAESAAIIAALEQTQAVFDAIDARPFAITEEEMAVLRKTMALLRQADDNEIQTHTSP